MWHSAVIPIRLRQSALRGLIEQRRIRQSAQWRRTQARPIDSPDAAALLHSTAQFSSRLVCRRRPLFPLIAQGGAEAADGGRADHCDKSLDDAATSHDHEGARGGSTETRPGRREAQHVARGARRGLIPTHLRARHSQIPGPLLGHESSQRAHSLRAEAAHLWVRRRAGCGSARGRRGRRVLHEQQACALGRVAARHGGAHCTGEPTDGQAHRTDATSGRCAQHDGRVASLAHQRRSGGSSSSDCISQLALGLRCLLTRGFRLSHSCCGASLRLLCLVPSTALGFGGLRGRRSVGAQFARDWGRHAAAPLASSGDAAVAPRERIRIAVAPVFSGGVGRGAQSQSQQQRHPLARCERRAAPTERTRATSTGLCGHQCRVGCSCGGFCSGGGGRSTGSLSLHAAGSSLAQIVAPLVRHRVPLARSQQLSSFSRPQSPSPYLARGRLAR